MNQTKNTCIGCSVVSCQFHDRDDNYCTLDQIHITTHEANPTKVECTDCASFKVKRSNM